MAPTSEPLDVDRAQPHWLYRLFDAEGALLYVGQTRAPAQRFRLWFSRATSSHRYGWFNAATLVVWQRYPDWWAVTAAEKSAIETERPIHNRDHQPRRVA